MMKQQIAHLLGIPSKILNDRRNQGILVLSSFVVLFACLLFLLFGRSTGSGDVVSSESMTSTFISPTAIITATKWWDKATPFSSTIPPHTIFDPKSTETTGSNCVSNISSQLRPGIYAYISLTPPLPNRLRSGAGKLYSYLGQVEPGAGIKIIDGPLCADSFSWWFVESTQGGLRGWTVEGNGSEQWIVPCPDQAAACNKPVPDYSTLANSSSSRQEGDKIKENKCKSDKLAVGNLAQVKQDNLLVIRSEPNDGDLVGRAGPLSVVKIVDGPACTGGVVWWKVNTSAQTLSGWATENNLYACSKEDDCN